VPRSITESLLREVEPLGEDVPVRQAVARMVETDLPALPVVDAAGRLRGIFGEREFLTAFFPAYVGQLKYAGFVKESLDRALEKRRGCLAEPVGNHLNTEHIDVDEHWSDFGVAEVFLHHRVLIVPVVGERGVLGVITRRDFFLALVERTTAGT
jgi:CBS domain-containing protein